MVFILAILGNPRQSQAILGNPQSQSAPLLPNYLCMRSNHSLAAMLATASKPKIFLCG